jgi:hypothetical protein
MRFKKLAVTLLACTAVAAFAANSAQAKWTVNGSPLGATESKEVKVSGGPWTLKATVLGTELKVTANAVQCKTGVTCTIDGTTANGANHSAGALEFTNVTVDPSTCSVEGGKVATTPLTDNVVMVGSNTYDKFYPETGELFTEFELQGAECPLEGFVVEVKGVTYGRASNTEVAAKDQTLLFNQAEEEAAGSTLHLGTNIPAFLEGTAHNKLSPEVEYKANAE